MNSKHTFRWAVTLFVIGIFSILTTFGIGMIQHIFRNYDHHTDAFKQHGWPFSFYYETTFSDDGLHGAQPFGVIWDPVFFFVVYSLLFGCYKLVLRSWNPMPLQKPSKDRIINTSDPVEN